MSSKKEPSGDERFSRVKKDPRFWEMPATEQKVKIDKRFQSMFHDERFKLKYTVDKRGRPVSHTSAEDLKRFYNLDDSELSEEEEVPPGKVEKKKKGKKIEVEEEEEEDASKKSKKALKPTETEKLPKAGRDKGVRIVQEEDEDSEEEDEEEDDDDTNKGAGLSEEEDEEEEDDSESDEDSDSGPDLARGKGNVETSSEDEGEEEEEEEDGVVEDNLHQEEEEIEHDWGEMWKDAPRSEEITRRLAVCNMNWDRIKAKDLLALFNSFKPSGGVVLSITIYPSEFGKERIEAEQTQGPLELTSLPDNPDTDTEEQRIYREKVRDYQFKRLRYYYAVVECDSPETAGKIYEECDGFEYESSCSALDLRFIPDGMMFEDEPRDRATDVDLSTYKPKLFTSTATTTAKVELTWDETDHDRITALSRNFNKDELLDMDFKAYLASSSEEEEEDKTEEAPKEEKKKAVQRGKKKEEEEQISKYRELLQGLQDKERKEKDKAMEMEITWVPGLKDNAERLVKKKMDAGEKLTPWEEFLQKKKEKKKDKKKDKKAVDDGDAISDDELPPGVDLDDPFFSEGPDGTAGTSRKTKKTKKVKKAEEERTPEEEAELEKQRAQMALLMDDDEHKHFNYDKIVEHQNLSKKKRKKLLKTDTPLEDDGFEVDVKDPRFQAMFTSHLYNLDPSDPAYKKTKGTWSILEEKQRRRERREHDQQGALQSASAPEDDETVAGLNKPMEPSLSLLIKSVRNKTEQFLAHKKQRTK